ncbi:alpha-amylase family glycosyl hydrolase [Mycoplasma enhydrae]|uniref:alpha-amylase family glycosyl hydrolase n=1 Tax=Mycoplasma enhydrae TaxID=2499220 RepID=UPI00197C91E9|nr:alpha-amylase family glycosyl hydrolase [Mycoplasma enhydrae]MBN4089481.1 glucan 1,6-alpha-glucosidase [Mycoplasma enhydrae]
MDLFTKRIILYELKINTFFDTNDSGVGDFNGILTKLEYFKKLNVNYVVLDNVLNQYQNEFNLDVIRTKYGSVKDFVKLVRSFYENNIKIAPTLDLVSVKQSYINWCNMMSLYNLDKDKESPQYLTRLDPYLINKDIQKISLSEIANFIRYFEEILDFYLKLDIKAIVLDNFEFLIKSNLKDEIKFQFLEDLYKIIKRKRPEITIILKSNTDNVILLEQLLLTKSICFDYLYVNSISTLNNKEDLKHNKKNNLNFQQLFKLLEVLLKDKRAIISLGSDLSGRMISKWGNEKAYFNESAKSFFSLLYAANNSIGIYYGDEIGMLRAKINNNFDFNNEDYNEEKRYYQSKNINSEEYFKYQWYFNKWTSYTWMSWNNDRFAGATKSNPQKVPCALNYSYINVKNQLDNKESSLNYVYFLNKFIFDSDYTEFLNSAKLNIRYNKKGIFKITKKSRNKRITFLINISNKHNKVVPLNEYSILSSTYANKFYSDTPKTLGPFESLILFKEFKDQK